MTLAALDIGGTHVSAARVDPAAGRVDDLVRVDYAPDASREELLRCLAEAAGAVAANDVEAVGVAAPGPFDYERGICLVSGLAKLEALYGADLRGELAAAFGLPGAAVVFLNDADAFLLGEVAGGAGRGHERAIGITLGTGLGSAFYADGGLVHDGRGVPPRGEFHVVPFEGAPVEERISARGLLKRIAAEDVREAAERAHAGDARAREAFAAFGRDLAEFLEPWVEEFAAEVVVSGGSITRSWDLFSAQLAALAVVPAERLDTAALLGAADYALLSTSARP